MRDKGDKVFKGGLSKFCGKRPLKNLKQTISLQLFKGCLPQNLLSPLLNTLSYIPLTIFTKKHHHRCLTRLLEDIVKIFH